MFSRLPLRSRFTLWMLAATLSVVTVLLVYNGIVRRQLLYESGLQQIVADRQIWQLILHKKFTAMRGQQQLFARDRVFKKALAAADTTRTQLNSQTSYNALTANGLISHLLITSTNGQIVAAHPEDASTAPVDDLIADSMASGKVTANIMKWDQKLVAVVVIPVTMRGRTLGAAVLIDTLDSMLQELNDNIYGESFAVRAAGSSEIRLDALPNLALPPTGESFHRIVAFEQQFYAVNAMPLASGPHLGYLLTKKDVTEHVQRNRHMFLIEISTCIVIVAAILAAIYFYIKKALDPLADIVGVVSQIAHGDFTVKFSKSCDSDLGELQQAITKMQADLKLLLEHIAESVNQLMSAAQIAEILEWSVKGAQAQQQNITTLVDSIDLINASVESVSSAANIAAEKARDGSQESTKGNQIVTDTVSSIERLASEVGTSSQAISQIETDSINISEIIKLIKNISEQTNLLALNAAIEAARAGDQGRGFAVVADEVRVLAQRTQTSAQEIQDMVESLRTNTNNAVFVMNKCLQQTKTSVSEAEFAGKAIKNIADSVSALAELNDQIVGAARDQVGINQEIRRQTDEINQVAVQMMSSQRSATMPSSEGLVKIACELQTLMSQFKLDNPPEEPQSAQAPETEDDVLF